MQIKVSHQHEPLPVTIFQLDGRINLGSAEELQSRAKQAHQNGTKRLVLDLSSVESITSVGLRAILSIHKMLAAEESSTHSAPSRKSGHLKLVNPSAQVHKVLTTAGFTEIFEIYQDTSEAVASF